MEHSERFQGVPHWFTVFCFLLGAGLSLTFLLAPFGGKAIGWVVIVLLAVALTVAWYVSFYSRAPAFGGVGTFVCRMFLIGFSVLSAYLVVGFGALLEWTVSLWAKAGLAGLLLAALLGMRHHSRKPRIPVVLPAGIWISALLLGWAHDQQLVRCDDYRNLSPGVRLIVPNPQLSKCEKGELVESGRFPRTVWQSHSGERIVFTTQGDALGFPGAVCSARIDQPSPAVVCIGEPRGKSQGLIEIPESGRLLVAHWGVRTPQGDNGGVLYELPISGDVSILAQRWSDELLGDGFYDSSTSTLFMYSDRINGAHPLVLPGFQPLGVIASSVAPGEMSYRTGGEEGVACGQGLGVAVRGNPYSERYLVGQHSSWIDRLSTTWGCDWDEVSRKVYVTVPNWGFLVRVDYDTGVVEKRWFVGLGKRSVAYDRERRLVYYTDFLRGTVSAFDEDAERVLTDWFVGRFSRWVQLSRDRQVLFATGNLGVAEISLRDLGIEAGVESSRGRRG